MFFFGFQNLDYWYLKTKKTSSNMQNIDKEYLIFLLKVKF